MFFFFKRVSMTQKLNPTFVLCSYSLPLWIVTLAESREENWCWVYSQTISSKRSGAACLPSALMLNSNFMLHNFSFCVQRPVWVQSWALNGCLLGTLYSSLSKFASRLFSHSRNGQLRSLSLTTEQKFPFMLLKNCSLKCFH